MDEVQTEVQQDPVEEFQPDDIGLEPETNEAAQEEAKPIPFRIKKMPNSIPDPLVNGFVFKVGDWAYQVYEEKSRGRKLIKRMGVVEYG